MSATPAGAAAPVDHRGGLDAPAAGRHNGAMSRRMLFPLARRGALVPMMLVMIALAMAGCAAEHEPIRPPQIAFASDRPLVLNVAAVEVRSVFEASDQPPRIEQRLPIPPETALRRWSADRLRAGGRAGSARFTITDAAVSREALQTTPGVRGFFTREQAERYDAAAAAMLEILDDYGNRLAVVETRAERTRTIPESARRDEIDRIRFAMIETLMAEFDREMEKAIRQHLIGWLL